MKHFLLLAVAMVAGIWAWAAEKQEFTVNEVSFKMVFVEGGTFTMGATAEQGTDAGSNESPTHEVTLSSFGIGETLVTQELWLAVMGSNPSRLTGNLKRPVDFVSWNDCQEFIVKLNELTGKTFRMPTEAEWEFAARGGVESQGYKYAGSNNVDDVAWHWGNIPSTTAGAPNFGSQPVATKLPNELGIYDMSGNMLEWCQDWYGNYSSQAQTNPTGQETGFSRILRGGGWAREAACSRVSYRYMWKPVDGFADVGMRLALSDMDDTAIEDVTIDKPKSGIRYNLKGQPVGKDYHGVVIEDGVKFIAH